MKKTRWRMVYSDNHIGYEQVEIETPPKRKSPKQLDSVLDDDKIFDSITFDFDVEAGVCDCNEKYLDKSYNNHGLIMDQGCYWKRNSLKEA